jgi:hypothetical protein
MGIDANDLVEGLMDEQARRNALFNDQPDINNLIQDLVAIPATPGSEVVGQTELIATSVTHGIHKWDDGQTAWGFWSWDT